MKTSAEEKRFIGPRDKKYGIPSMLFIYLILIILSSFISDTFNNFLALIIVLSIIEISVWYLYYTVGRVQGYFNEDSYTLGLDSKKIMSRITERNKNHIKIVYANNIKKMQYVRELGGTGSKIKIWPKDYDILAESGVDFGKGVLEYYKKHGTPVILFPPWLPHSERKKLKEAIEEFKKKNGIE